jgi:REP element-mobilizing transposase RayT
VSSLPEPYYVTARGDRREAIYEDDVDREGFLDVLAEIVERYNWFCHAYCLMTDHYHLLIETVDGYTLPTRMAAISAQISFREF